MPVENARFSGDELFYKWSEQISRYRATASGIYEIFKSKHKQLSELISLAGEDAQKFPRPLPEDIEKGLIEISEYSESLSKSLH